VGELWHRKQYSAKMEEMGHALTVSFISYHNMQIHTQATYGISQMNVLS